MKIAILMNYLGISLVIAKPLIMGYGFVDREVDMRKFGILVAMFMAVFVFACSSGTNENTDAGLDAMDTQDMVLDQGTDTGTNDVTGDQGTAQEVQDAVNDGAADAQDTVEVEMVTRKFTFKAVGGVSMGAESVVLAANHPEVFDVVGSLGGYVDMRYFIKVMSKQIFAGFCPMDQILANIDHVNEKDNPNVFCGPVKPMEPYEWEWDFNHWHADNSGGHWGRKFYWYVIEGLMYAYGNLISYNPDNPLTPQGVSLDRVRNTTDEEKCSNPVRVGKPYNYNAEYNPEGKYDLITFCDGEPNCGDNGKPEWLECAGNYDPDAPNKRPVYIILAVDYNGNGKRDYGEPVVINAFERYDDVGVDGCSDEYEDGQGGCVKTADETKKGTDPNGDNFDLLNNPTGTENDVWWEPGEPYRDYGLDGVEGTSDYGEGNGKYDMNPRIQNLIDHSARKFFAEAPMDEVNKTDFIFDGGIRDAIHALTCAMNMTIPLQERGFDFKVYHGLAGTPDSLWPEGTEKKFLSDMDKLDFTGPAMGKNFLYSYGNPDATEKEIFRGDGKHVGSGDQITARLVILLNTAVRRMPDPVIRKSKTIGKSISSSYYSEVLGCRRNYGLYLPPDYDTRTDESYPVVAFIPGHGMDADSIAQAGPLFGAIMAKGNLPYFMMAVPEGQCCYRHKDDLSQRECACWKRSGYWECVDPQCKAENQDDCKINKYQKDELVQECNAGHFFVNFVSDRWGNSGDEMKMRYEDSMFEFLDWMDKHFRTRKPAEYKVPVNW